MRSKIGFRVSVLAVLCALGCGSDDKVLQGEDEPKDDGGGATNGGTTANTGNSTTGGDDGGVNGDFVGGTPSDPNCDMNGIWIGNQVTRSEALLAGQFSNNWYYLELTQNGEEVSVSRHFDCGIEVRGTVTVQLTPAAANGLRSHNIQTGRKGTMKMGDDGNCALKFERFWSVRGADEKRFAPSPRYSTKSIAEIVAAQKLPTKANTDGAEDWDGDSQLGTAWQITGALKGVRNSVQRDWTEWFTDAKYTIKPATDFQSNLVIRALFDNEESVLSATDELLTQSSKSDGAAKHTLTLRFLGRTRSDPRVTALVKSKDFDTCQAVQAALPVQDKL